MASIKTYAKQVQLVNLDFSDLAQQTVTFRVFHVTLLLGADTCS